MTNSYYTLLVVAIFGALYAVTYGLQKKGWVTLLLHRRIWNTVLLVSFLFSALTGIIVAVVLDFKIPFALYSQFLWVHVETGIVLAVSGLFHALWHVAYYRALIFKK